MNNNSSKFVKIIRQKVMPLQKKEKPILNGGEEVKPMSSIENKYIGIDNSDMEQRVQHTIRNLMELDAEELAYIEDMNCKNMFIIVILLNKVVATLVENMMAMDY